MKLKFELLHNPPYSPDLAPSNFSLFQDLKKWLGGEISTSNEEVIAQTRRSPYFEDIPKSYILYGLES